MKRWQVFGVEHPLMVHEVGRALGRVASIMCFCVFSLWERTEIIHCFRNSFRHASATTAPASATNISHINLPRASGVVSVLSRLCGLVARRRLGAFYFCFTLLLCFPLMLCSSSLLLEGVKNAKHVSYIFSSPPT